MHETPDFRDGDGGQDQPADSLDVYNNTIKPSASVDEFLEENNLGLGYYDDSEIWQQLERFHDGMFARAAFTDKLLRRAVEETKRELALEGQSFYDNRQMEPVSVAGWNELDEDERAEKSRREFIEQTGEQIWERMNNEQRLEALEIVSGIDRDWSPPHLRILMAQHELARSRGARLMDNLFGRKSEEKVITDSDEGGNILGGGR